MAAFKSALKAKKLTETTWALLAPLTYVSDLVEDAIVVPRGFQTDFASVPRVPIAFWLTGDTAHEAAVVHDWLYQRHGVDTRQDADTVFLEAMEAMGIPAWRRQIMYRAVRLCGEGAWKSGPSRFARLQNYGCCDRRGARSGSKAERKHP